MTLLFLAFVGLIFISTGVTYWGIESQEKDGLIINLAGRQRMLIQEMTRLAQGSGEEDDRAHLEALTRAEDTFDQTLTALIQGGEAPYLPGESVTLPPARSPRIKQQLAVVKENWELFKFQLNLLKAGGQDSGGRSATAEAIQNLSGPLTEEMDLAVRFFEQDAAGKVQRLRTLQIAFLISALGLLAAGAWMTREILINPLNQLTRSAQRIGEGDLLNPVKVFGLEEIHLLSGSLEEMRSDLKTSREALISWSKKLESRVEQRTGELEALYEISRDISSRLEVSEVLQAITEKSLHLLGGDVAVLCRLDQEGKRLLFEAKSGTTEAIRSDSTEIAGELTSRVLSGSKAFSCGEEHCQEGCGILKEEYRKSHIASPLRVEGRLIGALCVGLAAEAGFSPEAESLLSKLANSAAIALENARLYEQAEKVAVLEERQRIAADMHDGLTQTLSTLNMKIDRANEMITAGEEGEAGVLLEESYPLIDQAVADLRRAITSLMEEPGPHRGLQDRLEELIRNHTEQDGPAVSWGQELNETIDIPAEKMEQIMRVANEAVINAKKHARASNIQLSLQKVDDHYQLGVTDDGRGFNPEDPDDKERGVFGLKVMQARAQKLDGKLAIQSALDQGTEVRLEWPISKGKERVNE